MGILRTGETTIMAEVYADEASRLTHPVYDSMAEEYCAMAPLRQPAQLTKIGESVNKVCRFFGIPELEVK